MLPGIFFDFRVEEMNWTQWRTDVGINCEEDPADHMMKLQPNVRTPGKTTENTHTQSCCFLLQRIHS